jgi:hypothetical protein
MHRPACDDPKQPENLAVAEMKVRDQSYSATFRRRADQHGAAAQPPSF